jgi:hypothetical protein
MSDDDNLFADMKIVKGQDGCTGPSIPLDQDWGKLKKLQWHAAVANARSDHRIEIRVTVGDYRINGVRQPDHFSVIVSGMNGWSSTGMNFQHAWTYINGIEAGAQVAVNPHMPQFPWCAA